MAIFVLIHGGGERWLALEFCERHLRAAREKTRAFLDSHLAGVSPGDPTEK